MGILDDAIREHLELKRKHGAESADLERLEQEAFGPATRPGDPEFATGEEPAAQAESQLSAGTGEDETTVLGAAPSGAEEAGAPNWLDDEEEEEPIAEAEAPEAPSEGPEADFENAEEVSPAAQARIDYAELDDTADHPAIPEGDEGDASPAGEAEPVEAPESSIFDQDEVEVAFDDLDLDFDEDEEDGEPQAAAPVDFGDHAAEHELPPMPESGGAAQPESGTEDFEFEFDEELEDDLEDEDEALFATEDEPAGGTGDAEAEGEEEDLLEETPDFLQDAPEGERLWFEQGKPKDFDFDD